VKTWGRMLAITTLVLGWTAIAPAASTVKLPPPDLKGLVPLAALPLDKPPVPLPAVMLPPSPQGLPDLPTPPLVSDPAQRPVAPLPTPRALACNPIGTVLGVASELIECGRARLQRGELEDARDAFQKASKESGDRRLQREARYWLGQTLLRLGRASEAESVLALVVQDDPRSEFGPYAADDLGWIALEQKDPRRAFTYFDNLIKSGVPPALVGHAYHGHALSLYGLKRYPEARDEWARLLNVGGSSRSNAPIAIVSEANFWYGDTLGRLGDSKGAVPRLQAFTTSSPRILQSNGFLSLGWWGRAAGQSADAAKAYRTVLSSYPNTPEAPWARAGLVQALLDLDDYTAAREEARRLGELDKAGTLSLPTWLVIRQWLAGKPRLDEARALDEFLLARNLEPPTRAWVLLVSAEQSRLAGQSDEARTRFELVRQSSPPPLLGQYAALRLAQNDFDLREFAQALAGATGLLNESAPADLRAAAMVLAGEAAYWSRDYDQAIASYTRFLSDLPNHPSAPKVVLSLGWAEYRRGRADAARQRFTTFAQQAPTDPHAGEALLLSAELAANAGDAQTAQAQLSEVIAKFPNTEPAQVAALNRALLSINAGRPAEALPTLSTLATRAGSSPYIGRVHAAKGVALLVMGRGPSAQPDFQAALGQGEDAVGHLGLGTLAFMREAWDAASREYTAAREAGSAATAAAADYGLAAAAFNAGRTDDFKRLAAPLLSRPDDPRITPGVLLGMSMVAAQSKNWTEARELAVRLTNGFPQNEATPAGLAEVGSAAGAGGQWALSREMYETLTKRYPNYRPSSDARLAFAEALLRTGAPEEARREIDNFTKASPRDARMPDALLLLAQAQEASNNRTAALETYMRIDREYPNKGGAGALLGTARLLQNEGRGEEARSRLKRAVNQDDPQVAAEAAYLLGEGLRAAGQNEDAVEAYMTAVYLKPDSPWARRSLLGAGQSFAALKQSESATIVYKKLLAASGVEPELATEARNGLKALGVN
jgi:TolA-binding protein